MAEKGLNRNAQRSIRLLKEAFMELLAEKPYESITVSNVARKADLNRGTFYAHFDNVDDLMRSVMSDTADTISEFLSKAVESGCIPRPEPGAYAQARRVEERRAFCPCAREQIP